MLYTNTSNTYSTSNSSSSEDFNSSTVETDSFSNSSSGADYDSSLDIDTESNSSSELNVEDVLYRNTTLLPYCLSRLHQALHNDCGIRILCAFLLVGAALILGGTALCVTGFFIAGIILIVLGSLCTVGSLATAYACVSNFRREEIQERLLILNRYIAEEGNQSHCSVRWRSDGQGENEMNPELIVVRGRLLQL